jgi:hypothetical protein
MRRYVLGLAALLAATVSPALVQAAGNFEFVVAGQPGLTLGITGFAPDGSVKFEATSGSMEQRDGAGVYIVRIDETLVMGAPLARWCVKDPSGKWTGLESFGGALAVCDDQPSETRGRYTFAADTALAAEGPAAAPDMPEMSVADAAACVQRALNQIGFDAGPVDGQMGRRTFEAGHGFAAMQPTPYPELSDTTAAEWCALLTAALADGSARGADDALARFRFGPDVDNRTARETTEALADVNAYFIKVFGSALAAPGTIYVSADPDWMADAYVAHLKGNARMRRGKREWFAGCHGGEAGYGFMFMCTKSDVFSSDWFGSGSKAQKSFALTHEYFHMLQYERAVGSLDGCCGSNTLNVLGPQWLVEGAAEYMAFRLLGDSNRMNFKREIGWHTSKAAEVQASLAEMQTREGYYAEPRASSAGMIAAHLLAERTGLGSLAAFYGEMGAGKGWQAAFETAFGLTPEAFSEIYEAHIR